jgi:hypothetical protein
MFCKRNAVTGVTAIFLPAADGVPLRSRNSGNTPAQCLPRLGGSGAKLFIKEGFQLS